MTEKRVEAVVIDVDDHRVIFDAGGKKHNEFKKLGKWPRDLKVGDEIDVIRNIVSGDNLEIVRRGEEARPTPKLPVREQRVQPNGSRSRGRRSGGPAQRTRSRDFLNPYVMIPTFDRTRPEVLNHEAWGDSPGPGHNRLKQGYLRGVLRVEATAKSPLLLLDQSAAHREEVLKVRRGPDNEPILDPSSLKGVIRSAFEAVTNSRFGIFGQHETRLAIRQPADSALRLKIGRVTRTPDELTLEVVENLKPLGPMTIPSEEKTPDPPSGMVSVPFYGNPKVASRGLGKLGEQQHGVEVDAWIHLICHRSKGRQPAYWYWRASVIAAKGQAGPAPKQAVVGHNHADGGHPPVLVRGRLLIGGRSFSRKHDERLVVSEVLEEGPAELQLSPPRPVPEMVEKSWEAVYDSYLAAMGDAKPHARHVGGQAATERLLPDGSLVFAQIGETGEVTGLFPVMIGREAFTDSPYEILAHRGGEPAKLAEQMSPADRVFGWVGEGASQYRDVRAYKGHAWVQDVRFTEAEVEQLDGLDPQGLQLATLNGPKPEQYRFYLKDGSGKPLADQEKKTVGEGYNLRHADGRSVPRKFYWPHETTDDYWSTQGPLKKDPDGGYRQDAKQGRYREYLAPPGTSDKTSRRIREWIKPGASFTFNIRFENVHPLHVGALLWLLSGSLNFGVGAGKPLGFGTVALSIVSDATSIESVEDTTSRWGEWCTGAAEEKGVFPDKLIEAFEASVEQLFPGLLKAFAVLSSPPDLPVHYPRLKGDAGSPPVAESYQWFVQNERAPHERAWALPDVNDPALPLLPQPQKSSRNG